MRVTKITAKQIEIPLVKPFVISIGEITSCASVIVKIETDTGIIGYGEGSATPFVTGETNDTALYAVNYLAPVIIGHSPFAIDIIHNSMDARLVGNGSAKAAIDIALYDIMAKSAGLPLYKFLGGEDGAVETDMTIGIGKPEDMQAEALKLVSDGYRELKIKAGADEKNDMDAIKLIKAAVPSAHLKVDANQGWSVSQAHKMLLAYKEYGVEAVEQPVPYWDIDGLLDLRSRSPIPIMADESCFTPRDAVKIIKKGAADIINIKLMKCGGIYRAIQICSIAEASGIKCMLGCMLESRIAIAAAAAFVASRKNVIYADLDSFVEFDDSSFIKSGFKLSPPIINLTDTPGHGVDVEF